MRLMSFALTGPQVLFQTKTVTRRMGWRRLAPGTLLQPVEQAQGLRKGARVRRIGGPIRVLRVTREQLSCMNTRAYGGRELVCEGFPGMTGRQFVDLFCEANGCDRNAEITRIEFEYVEPRA